MGAEQLITKNIDLWTSAIKAKATQGRGSSKKRELYGINKLRELILELAVRGKLVPQDPSEEPASILLERIAAKKSQLVKQDIIKKPKKLARIVVDELPFTLPVGWIWARLQDVTSYIQRGMGPQYDEQGTVRVVSQKCVQWSGFCLQPSRYVANESLGKYQDERFLQTRDLLLNSTGTGTVGRIVELDYIPPKALVADSHVTVIRPLEVLGGFLKAYISAPGIQTRIEPNHENALVSGSTKQVELNTSTVEALEIPLPPQEEQHRIVAKVDELMLLCNLLEQKTEAGFDAHQRLVDTLLESLTTTQDANELSEHWARLSEHFDILITNDYAVEKLKHTILQLAIMGKLVAQDPNDEPASELLKRIAAEKKQLIKDKKIKKQQPLPKIHKDETPFRLPSGWEWVKFGELSEFINGDRGSNYPNKSEYVESGVPWINTGHIEPNGTLTSCNMNFITENKFSSLRGGKIQPGDLVYCLRGATFGKTAFVTPYSYGAIASSLMIVRPYQIELGNFFYKYLTSPFGRTQIFRFNNGSAQPNLSANSVKLYAFPCPPINEQHRIVAKIDQLMKLCEKLKVRLQEAQSIQLNLADAIVYEVTGEPVKILADAGVNANSMKITTILSLHQEEFEDSAVIAPIIRELGGSADAKDVWSKTKMSLPEFYAQLKIEIDAKLIIKPVSAEFKEA